MPLLANNTQWTVGLRVCMLKLWTGLCMLYILHVEILHMYIRNVENINCEKQSMLRCADFHWPTAGRGSSPRSISHCTGILGREINHSLPSQKTTTKLHAMESGGRTRVPYNVVATCIQKREKPSCILKSLHFSSPQMNVYKVEFTYVHGQQQKNMRTLRDGQHFHILQQVLPANTCRHYGKLNKQHSGTSWSRFCKWNSPAGGTFQTQKRDYGRLHG